MLVLFRDRLSNEKERPQKAPRYPFWESAQLKKSAVVAAFIQFRLVFRE